jgi:molybdopterin-synthase adenylyltransferase
MLTDSQIERYSRQIVLPEVGSRGQERLLAASAEIGGGGSAAIFCAAHLAAAGVGKLHVEGIGAKGPLADALALHARNVDCVIGATSFAEADVTILLGKVDPMRSAASGTLVWGGGAAEGIMAARFPRGRGCISCLAALESRAGAREVYAQLLGALLATMTLRALLGIGANDRAELLRLAPVTFPLVSSPFPSRPGCPVCS